MTGKPSDICLTKASEHNLKAVSVEIPLYRMVTVCGVSGSGKSSLIYDVIANEAKRREKIARGDASCLDYSMRANFESLENLPFCKVLKQRGVHESIQSTLSTLTGLHELLRDEFVQSGIILSDAGDEINAPSVFEISKFLNDFYSDEEFTYYACLRFEEDIVDGLALFELLKGHAVQEVVLISSRDKEPRSKKIAVLKNLSRQFDYTVLVPILDVSQIERYAPLAQRHYWCENEQYQFYFGRDFPDVKSGMLYQKKSSHLLSFNSHHSSSGKCRVCDGKGVVESLDTVALIDDSKPLNTPFLNLIDNGKGCYKYIGLCFDSLTRDLVKAGVDVSQTFAELDDDMRTCVVNLIYPKVVKHQKKSGIGKFLSVVVCDSCKGSRLNAKACAVKLFGLSLPEYLTKTVTELGTFLDDKPLKHKKIIKILASLEQATLGYLSLDRTTDTLSGGELQRLKFSLALTDANTDYLYILDEPSTGLHAYNNHQLIPLIQSLRDLGNTILISEHNADYIQASDFVIEMGPTGGERGGYIMRQGTNIDLPQAVIKRTKCTVNLSNRLLFKGVCVNNIINEDFIIPKSCLVVVSGVSGSGKSSFIHQVLVPVVKQYVEDGSIDLRHVKEVKGLDGILGVVALTQAQIGHNSRSVVATYLGVFDKIRELYANSAEAKQLGFDKGYFSFNNAEGACTTCLGLGELNEQICPDCQGQRFKPEVLGVEWEGKNIDVLLNTDMELLANTTNDTLLKDVFKVLSKLGLSYLNLGRATPSLSGGESQRLRLASMLITHRKKLKKGRYFFILDEPTKGLSEKDIQMMYVLIDDLLSANHSVVVIEHNLQMIKQADYVIDIGLGSGKKGGKCLYSGSVEGLLRHDTSLTAKALNKMLPIVETMQNVKVISQNTPKKHLNNRRVSKIDCHPFYLDEQHFEAEKLFFSKFSIKTDSPCFKVFKTKNELIEFVDTLEIESFSFNPYVTELFKYHRVPVSLKKSSLKKLKKLGLVVKSTDWTISEWGYRILVDDVLTAYQFGKGWITVKTPNQIFELSTRLISVKDKVIGSARIGLNTFNLYLNGCKYCDCHGSIPVYDNHLILARPDLSVLEKGFFHSNICLKLKSVVARFAKEGLFDFSKPYNQLTEEEMSIFWFGFKEYEFLKPKGRVNAKSDYIRWEGLYHYVYDSLSLIEISEQIKESKKIAACPMCAGKMVSKELYYYVMDGASWAEILSKYRGKKRELSIFYSV